LGFKPIKANKDGFQIHGKQKEQDFKSSKAKGIGFQIHRRHLLGPGEVSNS